MEWPLFDGLSEPQRRRLTEATRRRRFGRGEVLFHEGDLGDSVHQIRSGSVALRVTTSEGLVAAGVRPSWHLPRVLRPAGHSRPA